MGGRDGAVFGLSLAAVDRARRDGDARTLMQRLEEQSGLAAEPFIAAVGQLTAMPVLAMADLHAGRPAFDVIPFAQASKRGCLPFRDASGALCCVVGNPFDDAVCSWAEHRVSEPFTWHLAHPADIDAAFKRHEESARAMDQVAEVGAEGSDGGEDGGPQLSLRSISADESPVVKLVNSMIYDALMAGASDIHLETTPGGMQIKYRLDGVLADIRSVNGHQVAEEVISRIKYVARADISERRKPQDGRFNVPVEGRKVDIRVSVIPSIHGENAVLRILDKKALADEIKGLRLDGLGFDADLVARVRQLAREAYGMLLVTGPTGSGKSTTLYATVSEINDGVEKIITIEDPVEYQLAGVTQIQVDEEKELTFAKGLRSILRHDPDKILVGEIRDPETAQIAIQAALTGHLVFSTVHANNAFDVIARLVHMGIEPYNIVSAMNAIVAQRLIRKLCAHCSVPDQPAEALLTASRISAAEAGNYRFRKGLGCGHCRGTGFRGRKAIAELLFLTDELRELILQRVSVRELRAAAARGGMRGLREAALEAVQAGETTLAEINRVTLAH